MSTFTRPSLGLDDKWIEYPRASSPLLFDSRGHRRTASLFVEVSSDQQREPLFTMRDYPHKGMVSAYEVYMSSIDEGDFAMKMFGCMGHLRKLLKCAWFMNGSVEHGFEGLHVWRNDMLARDMTRAKDIYDQGIMNGDLQSAKAMMLLISKMQDVYQRMGKDAASQARTSSPEPRRGTQKDPDPSVVDMADEIKRLREGM